MNELAKKISQAELQMRRDYATQPSEPNFIPLRNLCQFCGTHLMMTKNTLEQITAFFFVRHLDNLFLNLGTDTFFNEELQTAKKKIFAQLLESLKRVEQNLMKDDYGDMLKVFSEIVATYINQINHLNRHYA